MTIAGHITGHLLLRIDGAPEDVDMGAITLPLVVTEVSDDRAGRLALGIGVNLDNVRRDIAAIFTDNRED